jgi:hypothetical protein|tara:strand:+ start:1399 stop:1560 length:162 start_codon:yes stop_codon:yes gene_type:complete
MKTFKQMYEDAMTAGDAGIPQDTKDMGPKKKKNYKVITRNYIEVNGKRKRQVQ